MTMSNLSARMFFKVKFSVSTVKPGEDLLWKIVLHIRDWQVEKCKRRGSSLTFNPQDWTNFKHGGRIAALDNSVVFSATYFSPDTSSQYWACRIVENLPQAGELSAFATRRWITEIGYEQREPNSALFSCVVSYSDRAGFIGPYQNEPNASVPNLILNIIDDCSLSVFYGIDHLNRDPHKLSVGDWPHFFDRVMDGNRLLPYILVSPQVLDAKEKRISHIVDCQDMAKKLFANAVVFFYDDLDFAKEMSYLNEAYSCYGGAIRVYQPNAQEPYRHRYLSVNDIRNFGNENIIPILFRAFAQNCDFYENFFCVEKCLRQKQEYQRAIRLQELHQSYKTKVSKAEESGISLAQTEEEKRLEAETNVEKLREELSEERGKNHRLEIQVEQFRAEAEENSGLRQALDARNEISEIPQSAHDVVLYFSRTYADRLLFSEEAIKSMKSCSIDSAELWSVFFALANTMCELYRHGTGDIFKTFREQTGKTAKRGEGAETRKDKTLMKQFEISVEGEAIGIEAHITYAKKGQSIHFGYSEKKKKVVIGHCGKHLNNYTTRKVK